MNPFRRFLSRFRRQPGMIGTPPSARQIPADPGLHAQDFAHRYAVPMDYHVEQRMTELGIPTDQIGSSDADYGIWHAAFHPHGKVGGNIAADGRIIVDSAVFNLDFLKADYGEDTAKLFARSRLRDRLDAIIAHEYEEHRQGMSHVGALRMAPTTNLPISNRAREILRAMEKGWKWR